MTVSWRVPEYSLCKAQGGSAQMPHPRKTQRLMLHQGRGPELFEGALKEAPYCGSGFFY